MIQLFRWGTDGATLSYMGIPCPNLCTGGHNYHGRFEYCCLESMEKIVKLLIKLTEEKYWRIMDYSKLDWEWSMFDSSKKDAIILFSRKSAIESMNRDQNLSDNGAIVYRSKRRWSMNARLQWLIRNALRIFRRNIWQIPSQVRVRSLMWEMSLSSNARLNRMIFTIFM